MALGNVVRKPMLGALGFLVAAPMFVAGLALAQQNAPRAPGRVPADKKPNEPEPIEVPVD
jgi:hypothetical protein